MTYLDDMMFLLDMQADLRERDGWNKPSIEELLKDDTEEADRRWQLLARKP